MMTVKGNTDRVMAARTGQYSQTPVRQDRGGNGNAKNRSAWWEVVNGGISVVFGAQLKAIVFLDETTNF